MRWKPFILIAFIVILGMTFYGCHKKKNNLLAEVNTEHLVSMPSPTKAVPTMTMTPTPEPVDEHLGMIQSPLSGEWILEEEAIYRPFAVMFNNINVASPQSGIGDAKILYEALVEAGITRLMGIYEGFEPDSLSAERLGSIRSARHYFVSIASEYDAIYVHFGGTSYADKKIAKLKIDCIDGIKGYGVNSFYRDNTIKAPHNAFASLEGINAGILKGKMRTELKEDYTTHFQFYEEDYVPVDGTEVSMVTLSFSGGMQPYFTYNEDEMNYTRHQFNKVHIDYNTEEELKFKNIIIWLVVERDIDKNGYQTMDFEDALGEGYYITNGKMIPITWKKVENDYFMKYYDTEGNELMMNTGKTYIAVFPVKRSDKIIFE